MPKPYLREFREDVVRVARGRGSGVTLAQIASDFGIHEMTLSKWLRRADVKDGVKPGVTSDEARPADPVPASDGRLHGSGQVGSAGDNAAMESFFSLLQRNVLDRQTWDTREELRIAIVTWMERAYHHRRRRQQRLGRLTPIEFEIIMSHVATQAA